MEAIENVRAYYSPVGRIRMLAGAPALDFANTLHWRDGELLDFIPSYRSLVEFCGPAHLLSEDEIRKVLRLANEYPQRATNLHQAALGLRDTLKDWLVASAANLPRKRVPRKAMAAAISKAGGGLNLGDLMDLPDDSATALQLPLLRIAAAIAALMLFPPEGDIRHCEADACGGFFLNTSRSKPRRWCAMDSCGNRMKAQRFRLAHKV
jgi:predicted RNA-binding Zn ribbon-like protein